MSDDARGAIIDTHPAFAEVPGDRWPRRRGSGPGETPTERPASVRGGDTSRDPGSPIGGQPRSALERLYRPLVVLVLIVTALYWAQAVLIPVALAVLLTFLLSPVVTALERCRLGRVPAVMLVVVITAAACLTSGWGLALQLTALANELPRYKQNVTSKIVGIREAGRGSALEKVQEAAQDVVAEVETGAAGVPEPKPVPVVVEAPSMLWQLPGLLGPLAEAGLVVVLVIFMLVQREDLRNRLIRLLGYGRLAVMTRALDDAGQRVSRYLLMQSIINGGFGVALGIGLFVVGVPYALLWGCLAAALRFIPYVGPWMAALPPIALSVAVFPGWSQPVAVAGLVLVLELVANMVLEPWLYGRSIGVTETALLVAVAFWTWLWGPVGLLLATPLTVCLVVLGKHLPDLEPLVVLLGDEPVLEPSVRYYQRLVARDEDEATRVVQEYREAHPDEQVYDDVLLPALMYGRHDRGRGRLTEGEERFIYRETRDLVEELDHPRRAEPAPDSSVEAARIRILTCPARDEADELGLLMFRELLDPARCEVVAVSAATLSSELLALVARERPALACIGALPPEGLAHARYLCKRLRAGFPDLKIVVGRWGQGLKGAEREELLAAGADGVGGTLLETRTLAMQLVQHLAPGGVPLAATGDGESGERAEPHPAAAS